MEHKQQKGLLLGILLLLFTLTGCIEKIDVSGKVNGSTLTPESMALDKTLEEHRAANAALSLPGELPREAEEAVIYWENTDRLRDYIGEGIYEKGLRAVCAVLKGRFAAESIRGFELNTDGEWKAVPELNDDQWKKMQERYYYQEDSDFYLGKIFDAKETAFGENSLNIVISSFTQPGYDFSEFARELNGYLKKNTGSAVCLYGVLVPVKQEFMGILRQPETIIIDYEGRLPCYILAAGPEGSVKAFDADFCEMLDKEKLRYGRGYYANIELPALEFAFVEDPKEKRVSGKPLYSYNCGTLTEDKAGNIFYSTSAGEETKSENGQEGENIAVCSQIACQSKNLAPENAAYYIDIDHYTCTLYAYDEAEGQWIPCGKEQDKYVNVRFEPVDGLCAEEDGHFFPEKGQLYLSAELNFTKGNTPLDRDKVYRLELQLRLNYRFTDRSSKHNIMDFSTSEEKYNAAIEGLITSRFRRGKGIQYKSWEYSGPKQIENAKAAMEQTPNLWLFLETLEDDKAYAPEMQDKIEYIDFLFHLKEP